MNYKHNNLLFNEFRDHHISEYINGIFSIYENTKHMTIRFMRIYYIKFIQKHSLLNEAQNDIILKMGNAVKAI